MTHQYRKIRFDNIGFSNSVKQKLHLLDHKTTNVSNGISIFIPYRDRIEHLQICLTHLHNSLKSSNIPYEIIVVELAKNNLWNKGALLNSGILAYPAKYDCFCFHDVDFFAKDDIYQLINHPVRPFSHTIGNKEYNTSIMEREISAAEFSTKSNTEEIYAAVYDFCFGGIVNIPKENFLDCNGFSNQYAYWGFEDLDLLCRLFKAGFSPQSAINKTCHILPHQHALAKENFSKHQRYFAANQAYFKEQLQTIAIPKEGLKTINFKLNEQNKFSTHTHLNISLKY